MIFIKKVLREKNRLFYGEKENRLMPKLLNLSLLIF